MPLLVNASLRSLTARQAISAMPFGSWSLAAAVYKIITSIMGVSLKAVRNFNGVLLRSSSILKGDDRFASGGLNDLCSDGNPPGSIARISIIVVLPGAGLIS